MGGIEEISPEILTSQNTVNLGYRSINVKRSLKSTWLCVSNLEQMQRGRKSCFSGIVGGKYIEKCPKLR